MEVAPLVAGAGEVQNSSKCQKFNSVRFLFKSKTAVQINKILLIAFLNFAQLR